MISGKGLFLKKIGCSVLQGKIGRVFVLEMVLFLIIFCLPAGQTGFWAARCGGQATPDKVQVGEILRFHVRAHSNAPQDQEIKNYVARKILARFQPVWSCCRDSCELGRLLVQTKPEIAGAARLALQEKGFDYDVAVSLTRDLFPARFYEGQLYPPGEYTALYLVIGEGCGENWWCVLFPPLCFNLLPPLAADEAETGLRENEQAEKNAPDGRRVAVSPKKVDKERKAPAGPAGQQDSEQREWRFWLWEKICKLMKAPDSNAVSKRKFIGCAAGSSITLSNSSQD